MSVISVVDVCSSIYVIGRPPGISIAKGEFYTWHKIIYATFYDTFVALLLPLETNQRWMSTFSPKEKTTSAFQTPVAVGFAIFFIAETKNA